MAYGTFFHQLSIALRLVGCLSSKRRSSKAQARGTAPKISLAQLGDGEGA